MPKLAKICQTFIKFGPDLAQIGQMLAETRHEASLVEFALISAEIGPALVEIVPSFAEVDPNLVIGPDLA